MTGAEALALVMVITGASMANPQRELPWILFGMFLMWFSVAVVLVEIWLAQT